MNELDDIFDDELNLEDLPDSGTDIIEPVSVEEDLFGEPTELIKEDNSILTELLKAKGITNSEITIIDEKGVEQKVNFNDLSKEEQLEILNPIAEPEDNNLDDSEIDLINRLRENNWTVEDFLENYKQSIIDSLGNTSDQNYDIDAYDDQELFLLDLKNKYDLTDEELVKELDKELQDENLFKKKVDILRAEYKQLEDQYKETQKQEFAQQQEEQYNRFSETMVNVALETPEFYGIELEDDEKNEVLSFLLDLDDNGTSTFYKTLNDPKKLYEAAWFLRYGKESFDALKNAYETEIAKLKKPDNKPTVVHKNNERKINSIHDLI